MAQVALTNDVCGRIDNHTDYCILVTRPIVRVDKIEELEDRNIGGFNAQFRVTLADGSGRTAQVVIPHGAEIGPHGGVDAIQDGTVIKIDQMVRVPHGSQSIVVVYSADIITGDFALKVTDMDQIIRQLRESLQLETARGDEVERRLQALLPANLRGLSHGLVDLVLEAFSQVFHVSAQV